MDQSPETIEASNRWRLIRRACGLNLQISGALLVIYCLVIGLRKEYPASSSILFWIMQAVIVALGVALLALIPTVVVGLLNGVVLGSVWSWLEPSHDLMAALLGLAIGGLLLLPVNLFLIGRGFYADITDPLLRYPPSAIPVAAGLVTALRLRRPPAR